MTNMQFSQLPLYAILCSHEDSIRGALSMVEPYNQFKELYKLEENQFSQSEKKKYLDKIVDMQKIIVSNDDALNSIKDALKGFKRLGEHADRVGIFYKNKVIQMSVFLSKQTKIRTL